MVFVISPNYWTKVTKFFVDARFTKSPNVLLQNWCWFACIRNCWEYHGQSIAIETKMCTYQHSKQKRRNYHHEIGMFSKLPKFLVKLQMYCTRAIITCDWYIFYPIFHCGLYCKEVSVTDIYLLNKEILQFLGLKSTVYNWDQFQIKSRL